jgi:hypothetical protein
MQRPSGALQLFPLRPAHGMDGAGRSNILIVPFKTFVRAPAAQVIQSTVRRKACKYTNWALI